MNRAYVDDEHYEGADFQQSKLATGEYENCTFRNCLFAGFDFTEFIFTECEFQDCDFSMAKLKSASFRDVKFIRCKLLGLRFDECNPRLLSFSFQGCILNYSSFYKLKMKGIIFNECKLQEVEFAEADLTNARFHHCDLTRATFENTVLMGTDFRTANNYSLDPEKNRIKMAKFSLAGVAGLLDKYHIVIES